MRFVYGVVRAGHPEPQLAGVAGAPVELVRSGDLAAAVSDSPEGLVLHDEDAFVQLDVLIGLLADGPVLPVRFGTVVEDDEAVCADVLGDPSLAGALESLADVVELHVDAAAGGDRVLTALRPIAVDAVARGSGWAFLVRRADVEAFDKAVAEVGAELPEAQLSYVGPLPPAHFTGAQEGGAAEPDAFSGDGRWGW